MKKNRIIMILAAMLLLVMSCEKQEVPSMQVSQENEVTLRTKAKISYPEMVVYVETNDVNPLNAMDYKLDGEQFIDYVHLFAANIHKANNEPVLYLNDKLTPVLEYGGAETYVKPIKDKQIQVLLTILGDHQGIGVANMNATQQKQFVNELLYAYYKYGLDGIDFDDEYADYPFFSNVRDSYSNIITLLKAKLPQEAVISAFDWGRTDQLNSNALNSLKYITHGYFGSWRDHNNSNISGMLKSKWSPTSWNLGNFYSLGTVENYAKETRNKGYNYIMCFNLRTRNDKDPLPHFSAVSRGAYDNKSVTCVNGNRRRANPISEGYSITPQMAKSYLVQNNYPHY